jgi:Tfp pilus assembly protein PilV
MERIGMEQLRDAEGRHMEAVNQSSGRIGVGRAAGFSLLELMIAGLLLTTGLLGGMVLILTAVANDSRDKNDSSATVISQMMMEMIASVPANSTATSSPSSSVTITDCNPTSSSASHTLNTLGSNGGAGAPLTSGGAIDYTQATVSGYSMTYYACQASTSDRQIQYDVRWYVKTLSADAKLVVVASKPIAGSQHANMLAIPVSLRMIVGL